MCRLALGVVLMAFGLITRVAVADDVPDVSGTRTGVWNVSESGGTVTLTMKQNGSMVTGEIAFKVDLKGDRPYSQGAIAGTVSRKNGRYVLSFSGDRLRADLDISDTEIKGPFCLHLCGTMSFVR